LPLDDVAYGAVGRAGIRNNLKVIDSVVTIAIAVQGCGSDDPLLVVFLCRHAFFLSPRLGNSGAYKP
jgi:hypothetical protein